MRHRDTFVGKHLKLLIHEALRRELHTALHTEQEEARSRDGADKAIEDAFKQVRPYLRARDPKGLWHSHNIEYGFLRNLLGSRWLWMGVSLAAFAFAVAYGINTGKGPVNPASTLDFISVLCGAYLGWAILPSAIRHAADRYAESAWMSFLRLAEESKSATETGSVGSDAQRQALWTLLSSLQSHHRMTTTPKSWTLSGTRRKRAFR